MGGGLASFGGQGLCPGLTAAAGAVAMVIALGIELGMLYDYRVKDLKLAADGSAFLNNGSQCMHFPSKADVELYYTNDVWGSDGKECEDTTYNNKQLGQLIAASVHALHYYKGVAEVDGGPAAADVEAAEMTYLAARAAAGVGDTSNTEVYDNLAIKTLMNLQDSGVAADGFNCDSIYTGLPSQADCLAAASTTAAVTAALLVLQTAAGVAAAQAAATAAGEAAGVIAKIDSAATADTTSQTPAGTGDYSSQYNTAANAITAGDGDVGEAKADEVNELWCPTTMESYTRTPTGRAVVSCNSQIDDNLLVAQTAAAVAAGGTIGDGGAGDAAANAITEASMLTAIVADAPTEDDTMLYNLYLQCQFVNGLASVPPQTSLDNLVVQPSISRGGTLGVPLLRRHEKGPKKGELVYVEPLYFPPPMPSGVNGTIPVLMRGKLLYGMRMGWSLFATIPAVVLIVYLGVDSVFAAACYLTRNFAFQQQKFEDVDSFNTANPEIAQSLATIQAMRWMRLSLSITGFLIVLLLKVFYDLLPWNFGALLPRAGVCPSQGNGWESEEGVAISHVIVIILILANIILLPLAVEVGTGLVQTGSTGQGSATDQPFWTGRSARRVTLWIFLITVASLVLIGLESVNATAWGIAWANRLMGWTPASENDLTGTVAIELMESSLTGAVLSAVAMGVLLGAIYARWLFTSSGNMNKICSILWFGIVIAGCLPLLITFGSDLTFTPEEQEIASDCSYFGDADSFEKFICENRGVTFTWAFIIQAGILGFIWLSWIASTFCNTCTSFDAATPVDLASTGNPDPKTAAPFKGVASDRIPLLSLRVRR